MLFNSLDFAIFLPIVFALYWLISAKRMKTQNVLIVIASYVFYGWWDWKFLSLIAFSTIVDYVIGLSLSREKQAGKRKLLLFLSLLVNLGFLGFFKYFNFFLGNFQEAFSFFGQELNVRALSIVLPVGISFYTFQTLSYTIDIYRKKLKPTKDFVAFAAYVSFFPQLVAGPIERASNLLPQFHKKREFSYSLAIDGLRQILWGLFKKVVIADNCALYANMIFNNSADYSGFTLVLGALFFTFQIYGDFSGYSDIAIGCARLFGFNLKQNFAFPYFSKDIAEFWRRWHISLSTWFRDYLYIPLGGSRGGTWMKVRNTFIIFIVSGFWHGANWTFVLWGALNAVYFLPLLLAKRNRNNMEIAAKGKVIPSISEAFSMLLTFGLAVIAWVLFRAENLEHAFSYYADMFSGFWTYLYYIEAYNFLAYNFEYSFILLFAFFIIVEWFGREGKHPLETLGVKWPKYVRYAFYYLIILMVLSFNGQQQEFIYFQF